eukprot:7686424-Ditylum_brightwellii.AAC.1
MSGFALLGMVGVLGSQVRRLVDGLWKFGSHGSVVWWFLWVFGGIFLMCVRNQVFGLDVSRSGMLDLGSCRVEYFSWGVT